MQEVFFRSQKILRFSISAARSAFKHFATNSHTRFPYINIRCCNLTRITDFFLISCCYLRHISFLPPYILFFSWKFLFFSSCRIDLPYKSFFRFHCLKALLSPPLLDCQLNLFVKRSLNLDGYLFSCAWKSLSISFALSSFASTFIFCFAWKILSTGRSSYVIRRQ